MSVYWGNFGLTLFEGYITAQFCDSDKIQECVLRTHKSCSLTRQCSRCCLEGGWHWRTLQDNLSSLSLAVLWVDTVYMVVNQMYSVLTLCSTQCCACIFLLAGDIHRNSWHAKIRRFLHGLPVYSGAQQGQRYGLSWSSREWRQWCSCGPLAGYILLYYIYLQVSWGEVLNFSVRIECSGILNPSLV